MLNQLNNYVKSWCCIH